MPRLVYCPCNDDKPDPCPACGATVSGNDPVRGICQALHGYRREPAIRLVLMDRTSGEIVASTR